MKQEEYNVFHYAEGMSEVREVLFTFTLLVTCLCSNHADTKGCLLGLERYLEIFWGGWSMGRVGYRVSRCPQETGEDGGCQLQIKNSWTI